MKSTRGRTRVLTDTQVQSVLDWWETKHALWRARRAEVATKSDIARELGVSISTLGDAIARGRVPHRKLCGPGRPRHLTDEQLERLWSWYDSWLELKKLHAQVGTIEAHAVRLGVDQRTINWIVRTGGCYKAVSPDVIDAERTRRRRRRARLRELNLL